MISVRGKQCHRCKSEKVLESNHGRKLTWQDHINYISNLFLSMMTSSNGNIFRVTGRLREKFTGHRGIPLTKASDEELWYFLSAPNKRLSKQSIRRWFETPSRSLWRHCYNSTARWPITILLIVMSLWKVLVRRTWVPLLMILPKESYVSLVIMFHAHTKLLFGEVWYQGPLLLTWINVNPSMDK